MANTVKIYSNLINGQWMTGENGESFENFNPADHNDIVGLFPKATIASTQQAIASARAALPAWANTPAPARSAILVKASQIITVRLAAMFCKAASMASYYIHGANPWA